jgi:hypothetical protein
MKLKIKCQMHDAIGKPFSEALSDYINFRKQSGVDRCRSEERRKLAIEQELAKRNMTAEEYAALEAEAKTAWYRNADGWIIFPRHWISGMLVNAISRLPKNGRAGLTPDNVRCKVRILGDWVTDKKEKDTVFDRAIKNETSNQRRREIDEVLEDFTLTGEVELVDWQDAETAAEDFERIFNFALHDCGLGSARKMGYGRGKISEVGDAYR